MAARAAFPHDAFRSGPLLIDDAALWTDLYEITMAAVYHHHRMPGLATLSLFVRRLPKSRGYLIASGLEITAPIRETQLIETAVLNFCHYETLACTKAPRVVDAAQGRGVVEFGLRRTHAGMKAARAISQGPPAPAMSSPASPGVFRRPARWRIRSSPRFAKRPTRSGPSARSSPGAQRCSWTRLTPSPPRERR